MIIIIILRLRNNYIDLDKIVHTKIAVLTPGQTPTELAEKESM